MPPKCIFFPVVLTLSYSKPGDDNMAKEFKSEERILVEMLNAFFEQQDKLSEGRYKAMREAAKIRYDQGV